MTHLRCTETKRVISSDLSMSYVIVDHNWTELLQKYIERMILGIVAAESFWDE